MSDLIVIGFADPASAERGRDDLFSLPRQEIFRISEAVVATRDAKGAIKLSHLVHPMNPLTGLGSISGLLLGLVFLHPLFGVLAGAGAGAASAVLKDYGVKEEFIHELADVLQPGKAALVLRRDMSTDEPVNEHVVARLAARGGRVLKTTLDADLEQRLRAAFEIQLAAGK